MSSIVVNGDTSGSVTLSAPTVAGTVTVTLPATSGTMLTTASTGVVTQTMLAAGVAGNGPAFSAAKSGNQTGIASATYTKITFETETFDTNNNFASSRFTPTVAGYYQINSALDMGSSLTYGYTAIFKNGTIAHIGSGGSTASTAELISVANGVIYCNGSTDYIEVYIYVVAASAVAYSGATFSGAMVRAA